MTSSTPSAVGCAAPSMIPSGPTSIHFCNTFSVSQYQHHAPCGRLCHGLGSAALGPWRGAGDRRGRHACLRAVAASGDRSRPDGHQRNLRTMMAAPPSARSTWARASTIGICSRSAASSSSKPTHQNAYPSEAAPLRGGFFLSLVEGESVCCLSAATNSHPSLDGEGSALFRRAGSGVKYLLCATASLLEHESPPPRCAAGPPHERGYAGRQIQNREAVSRGNASWRKCHKTSENRA